MAFWIAPGFRFTTFKTRLVKYSLALKVVLLKDDLTLDYLINQLVLYFVPMEM